jgi:hypothetical protein
MVKVGAVHVEAAADLFDLPLVSRLPFRNDLEQIHRYFLTTTGGGLEVNRSGAAAGSSKFWIPS